MILPPVAVVEAGNNLHVAVVNSLEAKEPMVVLVREAGGQIVMAAKSVKKITSHQSAQTCATQRQINMNWLQLFHKILDPEYVSNALNL